MRDYRAIESVWDLIERYGQLAAVASGALTEVICACEIIMRAAPKDPRAAPAIIPGADLARQALAAAAHMKRAAILSDLMDDVGPQIARYEAALGGGILVERLAHLTSELRHRLFDVLRNDFLLHVEGRDVLLYGKTALFGAVVTAKFPKASEDIQAAGECLALRQATACVFHLMRVMEVGVRTLGKKLKVQISVETETWNMILDHVSKAIKALPAKTAANKKRKAELAAVVASLDAVRIATRNEVMHPKQTYTREQAHDVFNATRAFMTHLGALV